ncbi:hypothetical protein A33M_3589 [Rhodovulum sp. PH10]|uniref:hypothetical protein n=1 Tax=Rhodovulum sp. PH10 TaxID=1187851 RepID=UPI00027C2D11|nr:hypothetical protein [Rhodovulum sp. PH10]EJW11076.1 hypothetical protein A33M_3589 [Rhodovulum sp. PH10]
MRRVLLAALSLLPLTAVPAAAGAFFTSPIESNDTGGIIAWAPEIEPVYRQIAADRCARWNKVARITSVHRQWGEYIAFRCEFPRGYDPRKWQVYGPPLRTRY